MENYPAVLQAEDLYKEYGTRGLKTNALSGVSLTVRKGDFIAIMGPSGSGKTTLLNLLSTIDRPSRGKVWIGGTDVTRLSSRKLSSIRHRQIGFVFQNYSLLDSMRIEDNIALPLTLDHVRASRIDAKVKELAGQFELENQLKKYPWQLSGGQKQRAAAARALITDPQIIFADEPTGALDSRSSRQLLQILTGMNERKQSTIVMVTHDALAASYAREVYMLKDGKFQAHLARGNSQKEFYDRIIDMQAGMGSEFS